MFQFWLAGKKKYCTQILSTSNQIDQLMLKHTPAQAWLAK
jgi:hypothetical protein